MNVVCVVDFSHSFVIKLRVVMNQADVSKLVSKLRIRVNPTHRKLRNPAGPEGRLNKMRETVTGLFKYERLELNYTRADEARGYAERVRLE